MLLVLVVQISLIININIVLCLLMGSVLWLNYVDWLMEFLIVLLGVVFGMILLLSLFKVSVDNNCEEYLFLFDWGLWLIVLLVVFLVVGLFVFGVLLMVMLFYYGKFIGMDVEMMCQVLMLYGVGLIGLIVIKILVLGFYVWQDICILVKIVLVVLVVMQLFNYVFVLMFGYVGLVLLISFGVIINVVLLFFGLCCCGYYYLLLGWGLFIVQVMLVVLLLVGVLLWFVYNFDWVGLGVKLFVCIVLLGVSLVLCVVVYFGILWFIGLKFFMF